MAVDFAITCSLDETKWPPSPYSAQALTPRAQAKMTGYTPMGL